jgi:PAS domain S-box-containing protein
MSQGEGSPAPGQKSRLGAWSGAALVFIVLAIVTGALLIGAVRNGGRQAEATQWERHTFQVLMTSQAVLSALQDAETGQRGYLITHDATYLEPYQRGSVATRAEMAKLRGLTGDNPTQQQNLAQLGGLIDQRLAILQTGLQLARAGQHDAAANVVRQGDGKRSMDAARVLIDRMEAAENALLRQRMAASARAQASGRDSMLALGALGVAWLFLAGASLWAGLRATDRARALGAVERLEAEARRSRDFLRQVIDNSVDPILAKDREGLFILANRRAAELYQTTIEAMIGRRAADFLPPHIAEVLEAADREVMTAGAPLVLEEVLPENGENRIFQISKAPLLDKGQIVGLIAVSHDITDRKAVENGLRSLSEELEARVEQRTRETEAANAQLRQLQKMEAVGQLTGGIAHDFNNMLAIVIGSLDLAHRRVTTDPVRALACIDNAQEGARRAATLTARLLAFSRQQPLEPEVLDPNKLVGGMSELLRRTIGEDIHIETVLAGGVWRTHADAGQLENALLNLCVNARDAMPDGGHLTIETSNAHLDDAYAATHTEVEAGQYVLLSVTDTGTGMPPEVVERAFDPFYTTKGPGRGTGLGLSQVFGFVKQSGGHIKVYSEPGQGTTVKLYLPRHSGADAVARLDLAPTDRPMGASGEIILVAEDDTAVRHMSVDALRELGYTVIQAENAAQALQQLELQPLVSLLFTDIVMPDMNGRRLADAALQKRPDLKVLFTTGYSHNAVIHNGTLDRGVAFLPKPFSLDSLARKIRQVLDGKGANRPA